MLLTKKQRDYMILFCLMIVFICIHLIQTKGFLSKPVYVENVETRLIISKSDNVIEYTGDENVRISEEDILYVSLDILKKHLYEHIDYDESNKVVTITTFDKVIRFYDEGKKIKVNGSEIKYINPMIYSKETPLLPLGQLDEILKIDIKFADKTNTFIIKSQYEDEVVAEVIENNVRIKNEKSFWSKNTDIVNAGYKVKIIEENDIWYKVLTDKGVIGYIKANQIKDKEKIKGIQKAKNIPIWKPEEGKIILTWEYINSRNPDIEKISELKGVNVVSPTWIRLANSDGDLKHNIGMDYIKWAKSRGYKIWALFSNSFDPKITDKFLNNSLAREKTINELLRLVKENEIDGINIDFENVYLKNKEELVQFVRELTPIFHDNNLVVSIDVTVKGGSENWSLCYDRGALGEVVDYMAVMTYDEHWASSPKSGSVASIGWVRRGIEGILEEVPSEKLLLGIPFYTRIWIETPSKTEANKMDVKSKTVTMETANKILEKENIIKLWDEKAGQYYAVYIEDGSVHKIWIEDSSSIELKTKLVDKYNLAGVATWRRGFETENIWDTIYSVLY